MIKGDPDTIEKGISRGEFLVKTAGAAVFTRELPQVDQQIQPISTELKRSISTLYFEIPAAAVIGSTTVVEFTPGTTCFLRKLKIQSYLETSATGAYLGISQFMLTLLYSPSMVSLNAPEWNNFSAPFAAGNSSDGPQLLFDSAQKAVELHYGPGEMRFDAGGFVDFSVLNLLPIAGVNTVNVWVEITLDRV